MATAQPVSFGELLRRFRLAAGLSQEALAERAGLSTRGISDLERGVRNAPRPETIDLLADALGLDGGDRARFIAPIRRARETSAGPDTPEPLPHNLPAQLTSFIGREREVAKVLEHVAEFRLVTLTGSGGTGKTRLALQAAAKLLDRFTDGVCLVELAPLSDPARVPDAVASVLGVSEEPGRSLTAKLIATVRERSLLIVLDNCEHLVDACASFVDALLRGSSGPRVLATSREALGIAGEFPFRVPSLVLPSPGTWEHGESADLPADVPAEVGGAEAVRLFLERARVVQPTFRLGRENVRPVVNICRRLDGIPLALELAAARIRVLPVEGIASRLDDSFRILTGGARTALPRHQTLRALIDWSYHLLSEQERTLLQCLSVFAGGWTLEAAEAVGSADTVARGDVLDLLTRLVDKSLVIVLDEAVGGHAGAMRYRLLETVRQYARERLLESGEAGAARCRHLAWFAAQAAAWRERSSEQSVRQHRELIPDLDNLRAAIEFGLGGADAHAALALVGDLHWFWLSSGLMFEGRRWAARAISARADDAPPDVALVRALETRGSFEWRQAEYGLARETLLDAVALGRAVGDESALEASLLALGGCLRDFGDLDGARRVLEEALERAERHGSQINVAQGSFHLGLVATLAGQLDEAATRLGLAERLGRRLHWVRLNHVLRALATLESMYDDYGQACHSLEEAIVLAQAANERDGISFSLQELGIARLAAQDLDGAERAFTEGLAPTQALGRQSGLLAILLGLAEVARQRGQLSAMAHRLNDVWDLLAAAIAVAQPGGVLASPVARAHCVSAVASLLALAGSNPPAARLLGAIVAHRPGPHTPQRPLQLAPRLWLAREEALKKALRAELGDAAFATAFDAGQARSLDEAIVEAGRHLMEIQLRSAGRG